MSDCLCAGSGGGEFKVYTKKDCKFNEETSTLTLPIGTSWEQVVCFSMIGFIMGGREHFFCTMDEDNRRVYLATKGTNRTVQSATFSGQTFELNFGGWKVTQIYSLYILTR